MGKIQHRLREQARSHKEQRPPRALFQHSTGRALARLQLVILIHPPRRKAERRYSSGDWREVPFDAVEPIACRCSEANRRAMPPEGYRSEGTPSPSEGPNAWGERFLLTFLGACKKVSRRKGETLSGRYRSNGYVHPPEPGRPEGRLRGQPRPHKVNQHTLLKTKKRATEVAQNALRARASRKT